MISRSSATPPSTALKGTNSERVACETTWASVVLPEPGGPHRISEGTRSRWIVGEQLALAEQWRLAHDFFERRGRMRSASGAGGPPNTPLRAAAPSSVG